MLVLMTWINGDCVGVGSDGVRVNVDDGFPEGFEDGIELDVEGNVNVVDGDGVDDGVSVWVDV